MMNYYDIFNWKEYLSLHPDLIKNHIDSEEEAYEHWINYGIKENRKGFLLKNKYGLFDWKYYIDYYSDLKKNNINTEEKAYKHWINYGIKEKRFMNSSNQIFDIKDINQLNFYIKKETSNIFISQCIYIINNNSNNNSNNKNNKRKRIAILFSGQMRTNSLGIDTSNNNNIINSIYKNIINNELKNKYDYDVFISTDNAQINKCKIFFGNNLKNIHCFDTNFYMNNIKNKDKIPTYQSLYNLYVNRNYNNYSSYPNSVWQFYRLYDCFNLMCNYQNIENYDYIIRARLDTIFHKNIIPILHNFDTNQNIDYFGVADRFSIGRIQIMKCYCNMITEKYGTYNDGHKIKDELRWKYSPEYQLKLLLLEFYKNNNINYSIKMDTISNTIDEFCDLYRKKK